MHTQEAGRRPAVRKLLKKFPTPISPLLLQEQFAHVVHKFERFRAQQREAEHLFQALLHRAFRGELSRDSFPRHTAH
jgi:hypothetical protein